MGTGQSLPSMGSLLPPHPPVMVTHGLVLSPTPSLAATPVLPVQVPAPVVGPPVAAAQPASPGVTAPQRELRGHWGSGTLSGAPNLGQIGATRPSWTLGHRLDPYAGYKLLVGSVPPLFFVLVVPLDLQTLTD